MSKTPRITEIVNEVQTEQLKVQNAELLAACESAYRAIALGDGRSIDWDAIADELRAAIANAKA